MNEADQGAEFKRDLEIWERFVEAARREKAWAHERLNWLFVPQTILFAAYGLCLSGKAANYVDLIDWVIIAIPTMGAALSILAMTGVHAARIMYDVWWKKVREIASRYPDELTFGSPPHGPGKVSSKLPYYICACFLVPWLLLVSFTVSQYGDRYAYHLSRMITWIASLGPTV
ncbi:MULTISPECIES: hypothetical protein [Asticcacaulis]|uniref:RipA family octameric membrane protein n=1 Tax=Asticcacaulis TaxID=76890 RepID=UPI001FDA3DBD|nr:MULTISPECIES: hypothetical protein [Asticcacaulis]MBP2159584.1 hypothetical protein [Asticcacaulis solisilvae]MDR6800589.1 hypothetical protein [Asticcacaulis sp. BE141]